MWSFYQLIATGWRCCCYSRLFAKANWNILATKIIVSHRNMPTLGRVDEFWVESGNISTYLDRVEYFFIANDISHGTEIKTKCEAILLSTIGEMTFRILEDLCAPQKPSEKSFKEIKHLLLEHFKPKHFVIAESYRFYNVKKEEDESVSNFFVHLKHLSSTYEFETFYLVYSFAVVFFNVPKPGWNSSKNSWFKSVQLLRLQVADRLICKLFCQSPPRRLGTELGTTNTLYTTAKLYTK